MKKNSNLDEMQEQKLLKIEHNGYWLAFWGLLAVMVVQLFMGAELRTLAGEWIIFMVLALYLCIACLRAGIWDRKLRPDSRTNLAASVIGGAAAGLILAVFTYIRFTSIIGSLAVAALTFVIIASLCFVTLSLCAAILKKRTAKLEQEADDTGGDERR